MRKLQEYLYNLKNTFKGKGCMCMCVHYLYIFYLEHTYTSTHTDRDSLIYYVENNLYRKLKGKGMNLMNVFINMEFKKCRNSEKIFKIECETLFFI